MLSGSSASPGEAPRPDDDGPSIEAVQPADDAPVETTPVGATAVEAGPVEPAQVEPAATIRAGPLTPPDSVAPRPL